MYPCRSSEFFIELHHVPSPAPKLRKNVSWQYQAEKMTTWERCQQPTHGISATAATTHLVSVRVAVIPDSTGGELAELGLGVPHVSTVEALLAGVVPVLGEVLLLVRGVGVLHGGEEVERLRPGVAHAAAASDARPRAGEAARVLEAGGEPAALGRRDEDEKDDDTRRDIDDERAGGASHRCRRQVEAVAEAAGGPVALLLALL